MQESKLIPISGDIKITYTIKDHPEYGKKVGHHKTYEDFGEWICKQFDKVNIIDITDFSNKKKDSLNLLIKIKNIIISVILPFILLISTLKFNDFSMRKSIGWNQTIGNGENILFSAFFILLSLIISSYYIYLGLQKFDSMN